MISSENIKNLRLKTGAGMMDCKKALEENKGDLNAAADWLRKKGITTAQKKSSRDASDGLITIEENRNHAVIIEINSETDFVARNEDFQIFCKKIARYALDKKIKDLNYLIDLDIIKADLTSMIAKVGENLVIKKLKFIGEGQSLVQKYIHGSVNSNSGKIGVVLDYTCNESNTNLDDFTKNLCMHIAATDPKSLTREDLDLKLVNNEKEIYKEQLKNSGKPDEIIDKIVIGKINKYYEEVCLYDQFFVMENKKKIKEYIIDFEKNNNCVFNIKNFTVFKVGDNL